MSPVISAARRRLGWLAIRAELQRALPVVCAAGFLCAAARPLVWPLHVGSPWWALARAALLGCAGASVVVGVIAIRAWRARPSLLVSARRIDDALGLSEVVASGYAFEKHEGAPAELVRKRAADALAPVVIDRLLVPSPVIRTKLDRRWLWGGLAIALLGLSLGGIDPVLVERIIHPVTAAEKAAAAELAHAAEEAKREQGDKKNPKVEALAEAAQRAAEAAQRGDRKGAREAIEQARAAARSLEAEEREQANALRSLRDELEAGGDKGKGSRTASEALAKMMKELDPKDREALHEMAKRLERGAAAAEKSGSKEGAMSRVAEALAEARAASARGDSEGAKRAMERAARELAAMERSGGKASSKIAEGASALDRSMHAATTGAPSPGREGEGEGKSPGAKEGSGKSASKPGPPSGLPGTGPGAGDRTPGAEARRVKVEGDLKARTDVREGERAVSAIEGMGHGDDPRAYREIFPSYDTVVEDGLREDAVPAARRPAVRRYFSSIRPGNSEGSDR